MPVEAVAAEINALGVPGSAEGFGGDVASEEGIKALVAEVQSRTDKLHILMNNAGRTWGAPMGEHPYDAWDKLLQPQRHGDVPPDPKPAAPAAGGENG